MGIISKIQQEDLEYIRLEHFLFVLNSSLDGSGFSGFYLLPKLLDKGLRLSFTESGYVFDEQMAFKGDIKCALKRLENKLFDTDEPESKLYQDEIVKTQDGLEISLGNLLVKRADVEKVYSEYGENRFPWALMLWPQSSEDWSWITVDEKFGAMSGISINNSALDVAEDCIGINDMSVWDVALNLSVERIMPPSKALKQLAYSALQWVQISQPYHDEMPDWSKLPDELAKHKVAYDKDKYDFLECRFNLKQADQIAQLLLTISGSYGEKQEFTDSEIKLLNEILIRREDFRAWIKRKEINLPKFWFSNDAEKIDASEFDAGFDFGGNVDNTNKLYKERQKAVAQLKASREPGTVTVDVLLENPIANLLEEIRPENDFDRYFHLYGWIGACKAEILRVKKATYSDEARREDKLDDICGKLKEIDWHLNECPPVESTEIESPEGATMGSTFPKLEYGELEILPDDAISLYKALKLLGDDWTAEEFGINVVFGHICAFKERYQKILCITNANDYLEKFGNLKEFTDDNSYTVSSVLLQFQYSKTLLSECKSQLLSERYISFQQAKTRISALIGGSVETEELLNHAIRHNKIIPCHPFAGWLVSDSQLHWGGYFQEPMFDYWITKELGETETPKSVTEAGVNDGVEGKAQGERQSQLYIFIWRVHDFLNKTKRPTAQELWNEIQHRHKTHDTDEIIQEVDGQQILWCSGYGNEQKQSRSTFDKTLSNIRKNPPF